MNHHEQIMYSCVIELMEVQYKKSFDAKTVKIQIEKLCNATKNMVMFSDKLECKDATAVDPEEVVTVDCVRSVHAENMKKT